MVSRYAYILLFIISSTFLEFFFSACSHSKCSIPEYLKYIDNPDNGLIQRKQIGVFDLSCEFKPVEYVVIKDWYKENGVLPVQISKDEFIKNEGIDNFYLKIESTSGKDILKEGIQSEGEYFTRLEYFTRVVQNDLLLIKGQDTIACEYCLFERSFEFSKASTLVFGFKSGNQNLTQSKENMRICFDDQVLGIGPVLFQIEQKNISAIPILKVSQL